MAAISADDIFKCIILNDIVWIFIGIPQKFIPKVPFDNKPVLVQIMVWRLTGDKPLSETMLLKFTDAYALLGLGELQTTARTATGELKTFIVLSCVCMDVWSTTISCIKILWVLKSKCAVDFGASFWLFRHFNVLKAIPKWCQCKSVFDIFKRFELMKLLKKTFEIISYWLSSPIRSSYDYRIDQY